MAHKRGTRLDRLHNGNYRLILFGHFGHGIQSQEINNIALADLEDIQIKIDIELLLRAKLKEAENGA